MQPKKSLQEREKELQAMLATPTGRQEIQKLEARYCAAGGQVRPSRASVITYILVYERVHGLLAS
jgi:hypothetical protein